MDERTWAGETPCWIRLGEPCRLCLPGASGPQDCGLVYLVMSDPDLCAELARMRAEATGTRQSLFAESEGAVRAEHVGWTHG